MTEGRPELRTELRGRGRRLTPQRQMVLDAVTALDHATPEEILAQVRRTAPSVNISTVYRSLELLEELDLVSHTHLGHRAPTYHAAEHSDHLHLVCRGCGDVQEVHADAIASLVATLRDDHGFDTDVTHVALHGRCRTCR